MNKDVKKLIIKLFIFVIIVFVLLVGRVIVVTQLSVVKYRTSYQYILTKKYEQLVNINEPKIILLGGSNLTFGINKDIIEEKTGMPVVNMGLHAGMGLRFNTEIAKANIKKGDIIILAYEYSIIDDISHFSPELVVSGIDNQLEIYKYVPIQYWPEIIKYIPTYAFKKLDAINDKQTTGVYSASSFDTKGNMILERKQCTLPSNITLNYGEVRLKDKENIPDETSEYINKFINYVNEKGATVLYTFPSVINERFYVTEEQIESYEMEVDEEIDAKRISNIKDYIFEREYMYDTIFHLNENGANIRSEKLASDILNYLNHKKDGNI